MSKESKAYKALCTEFYELDKPAPDEDALRCYFRYAKEARGPILEPMCGTGRFLIPLLEQGYEVIGFDSSSHMLNLCRTKCKERGFNPALFEANFETFPQEIKYNLIFIPSGSFGLLNAPKQVSQALSFIAHNLSAHGKFVFEVETLKAIQEPQGVWRGRWVRKPDGSKIVFNVLSQFDPGTRVETALCRYELWEENAISLTEVEVFHVRHYDSLEIKKLLKQHGLKVNGMYEAEPHTGIKASEACPVILFECAKA